MRRFNTGWRAGATAVGAAALLAVSAATAHEIGEIASGEPSADKSALYRRDTSIDDSGKYRREVEACRTGQTQQARETCLEEARAAKAAKRRGELASGSEDYTANALARCQPLAGEYQAACQARVMGFGSTSGSVAGGGLLRQVETVVLPPGATSVRIEPQTSEPVVLVPTPTQQQKR
jgi:hypothetical protein